VQIRTRDSSTNSLRTARSLRLALGCGIGVLVLLATAVGASAEPPIREKYAQRQAILEQVRTLDEQVGAAAERWNGANLKLASITEELAETRRDLQHARRLFVVSQERIAERLRALYVDDGTGSTLEVILGARSLDEIIDGLDAMERIGAQDARIASDAQALRERMARRKRQLTRARSEQVAVVEQLAAERGAIEAKLAERQQLFESVSGEIARLEEADRLRQAELRREALAELARQREQARLDAQAAANVTPPEMVGGDEGLIVPQEPTFAPPPPDGSKAAQVVAIAMEYLGVPYQWGGASPSTGFDCSGLTSYVYAQIGVLLPHHAASQYQLGLPVSRDQLQPGDLVFFTGLSHMGMYIGGGSFIHAPRTGDVVKISSLSDPYYVSGWVGAKRVL